MGGGVDVGGRGEARHSERETEGESEIEMKVMSTSDECMIYI